MQKPQRLDEKDELASMLKKSFTYVEENPVDDELECAICHFPLVDPVVEPSCRQMFCQECLARCTQSNGKCPHCRANVTMAACHPPPGFVTNKLDGLRVVCPVCSTHVERSSLGPHVHRCPKPCKLGCGAMVAPIDEQVHESSCSARIVLCSSADIFCPGKGPASEHAAHLASCAFTQLAPILRSMQAQIVDLRRSLDAQIVDLKENTPRICKLCGHCSRSACAYGGCLRRIDCRDTHRHEWFPISGPVKCVLSWSGCVTTQHFKCMLCERILCSKHKTSDDNCPGHMV